MAEAMAIKMQEKDRRRDEVIINMKGKDGINNYCRIGRERGMKKTSVIKQLNQELHKKRNLLMRKRNFQQHQTRNCMPYLMTCKEYRTSMIH